MLETNARRTWHIALGPTDIPHTQILLIQILSLFLFLFWEIFLFFDGRPTRATPRTPARAARAANPSFSRRFLFLVVVFFFFSFLR